jgi:hypothetical protein
MIIVVGKWKQKIIRLATIAIVIALFAAAIPLVSGIFYEKVPVFNGWMKDENPSGNPMRVENVPQTTDFGRSVDQFVIKVQNFYHAEKE